MSLDRKQLFDANPRAWLMPLLLGAVVLVTVLLASAGPGSYRDIMDAVNLQLHPADWKVMFAAGVNGDVAKHRELIERALAQAERQGAPVAEVMEHRLRYSRKLHDIHDEQESRRQLDTLIASQSAHPDAEQMMELGLAYQDRASNQHYVFLRDRSQPSGADDQEQAVDLVKKAFGPRSAEAAFKLATLASIYADVDQRKKSDDTFNEAEDIVKTGDAKDSGWYVYALLSRVRAQQADYKDAVEALLHGRSLTNDPLCLNRIVAEFDFGLQQGWRHGDTEYDPEAALQSGKYAELDATLDHLLVSKKRIWLGAWVLDQPFYDLLPRDRSEESQFEERLFEIKEWLRHDPKSIYAKIALSKCYIAQAWRAQGDEYGTVANAAAHELVAERLARATNALSADLRSRCPAAFIAYGDIARGQGVDRQNYDQLLGQCHKLWPTYLTMDQNAMRYIYRHGKEAAVQSFVTDLADATGGAGGDERYAQLAAWWFGGRMGQKGPFDWQRVKSGFRSIFAEFPDSREARKTYVEMALSQHDDAAVRAAFDGTESTARAAK